MLNNKKYINIGFPFTESNDGNFLKLNNTDKEAIKSDLMHLVLTKKGERLYMPDFGTNLMKYIYDPNDDITQMDITKEMSDIIKKYLPNLTLKGVNIDKIENSEYGIRVRIDYTITEDVFQETDFVIIEV